jgi:hypothetical protein
MDEFELCRGHEVRFGQVTNYGFIIPMEEATWLSPIVVVSKKNQKLRICMDFRKLNVAKKNEPYPLPFMEEILDMVLGHEVYSFLDGFLGYH